MSILIILVVYIGYKEIYIYNQCVIHNRMNIAIYKYLFRIIPNKNGKSYFYGSFLVLKKTVDLLIGYKVGLQLTNFCFTASLFVVKLIYLLCFIRSNISDSTSYMKEQHIKRYMFLKKHVKFINVPTYNHSFKHFGDL